MVIVILFVLHPNRTSKSGMVSCFTKLKSCDLFCFTIAKPPGITEKKKRWYSWKSMCQGLGLGTTCFSTMWFKKDFRVSLGSSGHYRGWLVLAGFQPLKKAVSWARGPWEQKAMGELLRQDLSRGWQSQTWDRSPTSRHYAQTSEDQGELVLKSSHRELWSSESQTKKEWQPMQRGERIIFHFFFLAQQTSVKKEL